MSASDKNFIEISSRYEIIEELGQGGAGVVYRAHDSSLDIDVAIKVLRSEAISKSAIRFQKEAKATARMNHDNVVKVLDFGQTTESGLLYLVQEYVSGESLDDLIRREGPLKLKQALNLFIQICKGVEHAHDCAILHRDLKPSNVLLNYRDSGETIAKIGDFGLAKILDEDGMVTLTAVSGSPFYMSPEQIDAVDVDERSDIYSLGCLFYEMLSGKVPYEGKNIMETFSQHKTGSYPSLLNKISEIEGFSEIDRVVERCLQSDPGDRYRNVSELVFELEGIQVQLLELEEEKILAKKSQDSVEIKFLHGLFLGSTVKKTSWAIVAGGIIIGAIASISLVSTVQKDESQLKSEKLKNEEYIKAESDGESKKYTRRIDMRKDFMDSIRKAPAHFIRKHTGGKDWLYSLAATITDNDIRALNDEADVSNIWIMKSKIKGTGFESLKDKKILSLNLLKSPVTDEGLKTICQISSIETLRLKYDNKFTNKSLQEISKLPNLRMLYLTSSHVTDEDMIALLPKLKSLRNLSIYGMKQLSNKIVPSLINLKNLQYLNVGGTSITPDIVNKLPRLKKLVYLDVSKFRLKDEHLKIISRLKLDTLVLTDNYLVTAKGLSYLKNMPSLRTVFLRRCFGIDKASLRPLMLQMPKVRFEFNQDTVEEGYANSDKLMGPLKDIIQFNIQDENHRVN